MFQVLRFSVRFILLTTYWLEDLFDQVFIPNAVEAELRELGEAGYDLQVFNKANWLKEKSVRYCIIKAKTKTSPFFIKPNQLLLYSIMKILFSLTLTLGIISSIYAQNTEWLNFDAQLSNWLADEKEKITQTTQSELHHINDWESYQATARTELKDMLGLNPFPDKTPLNTTITGVVKHESFRVEKLHFQSMPGLYVTANLYIPDSIKEPLPAILYVCGHANVKENGISYGAKANYQHHPAWFARNGYVCLIIDTYQLGEIEGIHHGLYSHDRWWWISRGFTPAGVEAWNGIRALDYLESRPEVDGDRIGMTGRSGGGVYTWWVAALDDRIKAAVPVAGITDMTNHVIDGCVEGHCDCMYMVNRYRWDYSKVAALLAPRPLLISNSDQDPIFPIDGVFRLYQDVRKVYQQLDALPNIALNTTAGPHKDTQPLRIHAFSWFNHHLKGHDELIDQTAVKLFKPEDLRVFRQLPQDQINTRIDEVFVPKAPTQHTSPNGSSWEDVTKEWKAVLDRYAFANPPAFELKEHNEYASNWGTLSLQHIQTDAHTWLPLFHLRSNSTAAKGRKIIVLDDNDWSAWASVLTETFPEMKLGDEKSKDVPDTAFLRGLLNKWGEIVLISMRGNGPATFSGDKRTQTHIKRRYYLLGRTLEELQTLDILQGLRALNIGEQDEHVAEELEAHGNSAVLLAYASLFISAQTKLNLHHLPVSHREGPAYMGILKYLDVPEALLMSSQQHQLNIIDSDSPIWKDLIRLSENIGGPGLRVED